MHLSITFLVSKLTIDSIHGCFGTDYNVSVVTALVHWCIGADQRSNRNSFAQAAVVFPNVDSWKIVTT